MIVEDEMLVAMEMESLLEDQGCTVVGPVATVERALALIDQEQPEAAILDVNLDGQTAIPVAAALNARGVPFLLATGYGGAQAEEPELKDAPRIDKPVSHDRLMRILVRIFEAADSNRPASPSSESREPKNP